MPGDERGLRRPRQDLILSGQNIFINQPRQVICLVNIVAECAIAGLIASQCYGAGNMPSNREDLLEAVTEAARSGVMVLVVTQCAHGGVSGDYETGQALLDAGAIPGSDITQVS